MNARPFDQRDQHTTAHRAWLALIEARIQEHREANDRLTSDERQTAITRGRIAELKELLALANPAPANDADPARHRQSDPSMGD